MACGWCGDAGSRGSAVGGGEVSVIEAEADARDLFRNCDGLSEDGMEAWMADQPWEVAPGGWMVTSEL